MSQTTNIEGLQTILETVNSLPDAGSGGGGGESTVTIVSETPVPNSTYFIYFLDKNAVVVRQEYAGGELLSGLTIKCLTNSFVYTDGSVFIDYEKKNTENIELVDSRVLMVRGDGTFYINQ